MVVIIHNKLVRDNIPKIINDQENQSCEYHIIENDDEYFKYLIKKVDEEIHEFYHNPSSEEMADVIEVLMEITRLKNIKHDVVEDTRVKKLEEKGGFKKRYVLEKVFKK
jgi:predicted house-cleaning noncanonical NTP pyrophosphatase (MazG superfamily)